MRFAMSSRPSSSSLAPSGSFASRSTSGTPPRLSEMSEVSGGAAYIPLRSMTTGWSSRSSSEGCDGRDDEQQVQQAAGVGAVTRQEALVLGHEGQARRELAVEVGHELVPVPRRAAAAAQPGVARLAIVVASSAGRAGHGRRRLRSLGHEARPARPEPALGRRDPARLAHPGLAVGLDVELVDEALVEPGRHEAPAALAQQAVHEVRERRGSRARASGRPRPARARRRGSG
jgi:hypothetical protein